jgi:hypothetical protein
VVISFGEKSNHDPIPLCALKYKTRKKGVVGEPSKQYDGQRRYNNNFQ